MCSTSEEVKKFVLDKFDKACPNGAKWCDGVNLDYIRFIEVRDLINSSRGDTCYCDRC